MKMELKELKNKIVALSSIYDNKPPTIAVEVNDIIDNKEILITDNQMKLTPICIKNNPNVCIVYWDNNTGVRIEGVAEYFNKGRWLEIVKNLRENNEYSPKGAILIRINKIFDL